VFDARYRDFPLPAYSIPVVAFALIAFARGSEGQLRAGLEERVLAWIVAVSAPVVAFKETLANHDALWWWALAWLLALPVLFPEFSRRAGGEPREA